MLDVEPTNLVDSEAGLNNYIHRFNEIRKRMSNTTHKIINRRNLYYVPLKPFKRKDAVIIFIDHVNCFDYQIFILIQHLRVLALSHPVGIELFLKNDNQNWANQNNWREQIRDLDFWRITKFPLPKKENSKPNFIKIAVFYRLISKGDKNPFKVLEYFNNNLVNDYLPDDDVSDIAQSHQFIKNLFGFENIKIDENRNRVNSYASQDWRRAITNLQNKLVRKTHFITREDLLAMQAAVERRFNEIDRTPLAILDFLLFLTKLLFQLLIFQMIIKSHI